MLCTKLVKFDCYNHLLKKIIGQLQTLSEFYQTPQHN
uniref:Uncharacterized protein n=1 Tax=Triticum urartu TaxID=4572 RepID=A0A8R7TXD7_TRIUA